jgi:hypothetical protein
MGPYPPRTVCWCLCGILHPSEIGVCEVFSAVTTQRFEVGDGDDRRVVEVPLCAPCLAAQGFTELGNLLRRDRP